MNSQLHDHQCRCQRCKPPHGNQWGSVIAPHSSIPPHVRRNMDRIVAAVMLAVAVLGLVCAWKVM